MKKNIVEIAFIIIYFLFLVLVIFFAIFIHIAYIQPYIREEYGHLHWYISQAVYISLLILLLAIYISKDKKRAKRWLMIATFIALIQILYMEYKHFLIYYKNFTYKIIFLKEGKEFWTWKKNWKKIQSKYTIKLIAIPDKYKKYNKDSFFDLINKNTRRKCILKKEDSIQEYMLCSTDDGFKYTYIRGKDNIVNNPDECFIKIINMKGNEYFELCRKGHLWFMKRMEVDRYGRAYSTGNGVIYDVNGYMKELKNFVNE